MNPQCILIHYHEIGLKGDNRSWFEKIFINNIQTQISNLPYSAIKLKAARVLILGIDSHRYKNYQAHLKNVMGLKSACLMAITELDLEDINLEVQTQIQELDFSTFRISTKRQDKNFHLTSQDINQDVGANVLKKTSKPVNLNNPDLNIAQLEYDQSEKDSIIARSDLTPTAKLSFERSYSEDLSSTYDEREKDILKATVSWPFYSGGKNIAKYKKNKNLQTRKRLLLDNTTRSNETNVASAWSNFQSSKSLLNSVELQVKAAEIANEGITAEYESGFGRTTLEVIQSNSFLLNAQISLANSERNYLLSQFNLLKSIGLLNSDYLKIK